MNGNQESSPVRDVRWQGERVVIDVAGDVDMTHSAGFQGRLTEVIGKSPRHIVVNMSNVTFMDSSGIASLVKLESQARDIGAKLSLVGVNKRVLSILQITRLDSLFKIFDTEEEALSTA